MKTNTEDRIRRITTLLDRYDEQKAQGNHEGAKDTLKEMKQEEDALRAR